jgi:hypothetical protein
MAADVIGTFLRLLTKANRDAARAAQQLARLLRHPAEAPALQDCEFTWAGKTYRAKLTAGQCEQLTKAGRSPPAVEKRLRKLLAAVNSALAGSLNQVLAPMGPGPTATRALAVTPPQLGACDYTNVSGHPDCAANVTRFQCEMQLHGLFRPGGSCS